MPVRTQKAIFLDKGGTLVQEAPYNVDPERMALCAGAVTGIPLLFASGYRIVVVSHQSGVARGMFREAALAPVEARLRQMLSGLGVPLSGFYYCPHHPQGSVAGYAFACACRKPAPGMLHRAASELRIDLAASWFIGDLLDDMEAAHAAGSRALLIDNGHETEWRTEHEPRRPDRIANDLAEAALIIASAAPRRQSQVT